MVSLNHSARGCLTRPGGRRSIRSGARGHGRRMQASAAPRPAGIFFSCVSTQQMKRPRTGDWIAGAATLLAIASWGMLAAVLGG